jgi:hypothetical protein
MCNDLTIQELLPAYAEQKLDSPDTTRVEEHLAICEDCVAELSLLRIVLSDAVPDPGEAFWTAMPGRVYRAVQEQKAHPKRFGATWFMGRLTMPRWVLAASTIGVLIVVSIFMLRALQPESAPSLSREYALSEDLMESRLVNLGDLGQDEANAIDTWTGKELTSIAQEAEPVLVSSRNDDIDEDLGELNTTEIQRLSQLLDQWEKQEG